MEISVLQWNVLYLEKADSILELIHHINADIVCLQELTQTSTINQGRDVPAEIAALGYEHRYHATGSDSELIIGNGVFSKFPILDSRVVELTPEDPDNKDFPQFSRAYVEATLQLDKTRLVVGNAHLSYSPNFEFFPAKQAEAEKFIDTIRVNTSRYLLMGDFNSTPDSQLVKQLDDRLAAVGPSYEQATWTTKPFEMHGFAAKTLDWRLDYIYATPDLEVLSSEIVQTNYSDHLPILAKFDI